MSKRQGYCPKCKKIVDAVSRTDASSLFCSEHPDYVRLTRKPKENR